MRLGNRNNHYHLFNNKIKYRSSTTSTPRIKSPEWLFGLQSIVATTGRLAAAARLLNKFCGHVPPMGFGHLFESISQYNIPAGSEELQFLN